MLKLAPEETLQRFQDVHTLISLANKSSSDIAQILGADDWNWLVRENPFVFDVEFLTESGLLPV